MMDEQLFGHQTFKNKGLVGYVNEYLNAHYDPRGFSYKGDCESQSLTLCRYLSFTGRPIYVAQLEGTHTVVYFDNKYWIDCQVGLIWNKDRTKYYKLDIFNQDRFDYYYGLNGVLEMNNDIIFLQISEIGRSLDDVE